MRKPRLGKYPTWERFKELCEYYRLNEDQRQKDLKRLSRDYLK